MTVLRLSAAGRWAHCSGSPRLESLYPERDSEVAREGTAAHFMAEQVLKAFITPESLIGQPAPNGVIMDSDMAEHVGEYVRYIQGRGIPYHVEAKVHPFDGVEGTLDCGAFDTPNEHLYIDDLKYGWRPVEVVGNWQVTGYAGSYAMLVAAFNLRVRLVTMTICQPRPHHPRGRFRSWTITGEELSNRMAWLQQAAAATRVPDAPVTTGPWCRDCDALHACSAAHTASMNAIDVSATSTPDDLSGKQLASQITTLRRARAMVDQRLEALEAHGVGELRAGRIVPGYALEASYGTRRWKDLADVPALEIMTGKTLTTSKPITPAAAEKAGAHPELVKLFTTRPSTGHKLTESDIDNVGKETFGNGR